MHSPLFASKPTSVSTPVQPVPDPEIAGNRDRLSALRGAVDEIDLGELLRKLWQQRNVIAGTVILLTAVVAIVVFQLKPLYESAVLVMIEPRQAKIVNLESVFEGLPGGSETINSEIEIIRSRHLAGKVVERLKLYKDPEFNAKLRDKTAWAIVVAWVREQLGIASKSPLSPEEAARLERNMVVTAFRDHLEVKAKARSRVIRITVESDNPAKAALIANTVGDLYLVDQLEAKYDATRRATNWLGDRMTELRKKVAASEQAVVEYRRKAGLVQGKDAVSITTAQISEISSQLIIARSKRAQAEARLEQVRRLIKSNRGMETAAQVLSSPLIQSLKEQESKVLRKAAELSSIYGPKHPQMINVRAEIRDLRRKIATEVKKIITGLRNEVDVAKANEGSLAKSLKELEQRIGQLNAKDVQLRALEREAKANRSLLETFLTRFKETSAQKDIQSADARIISAAAIPIFPSFPNKRLAIAVTIIGSFFLGIVLVFVLEQLDAGFRSMEQVEQIAGVSALGLIPALKGESGMPPERYVIENPISAYAESIRNIHVGLALSNVDAPPKVVLVTSSMPEEGKTATSLSLARLVAQSGRKVIIIDCDLRRPSVHERLGLPGKPGLIELLAGSADPAEVIIRDDASGAWLIPAGEHAPNPTDLLGSEHMRRLLHELAESHDLVVLDSSPVMAVSDARILARLADKIVFVVRWEKTRRETAVHGLKQIREAGGSIAGVVLSRVNVRKHARYGYADSGYYHGKYAKYYTS